jgi:phospholipid transport system substrate-binding protein
MQGDIIMEISLIKRIGYLLISLFFLCAGTVAVSPLHAGDLSEPQQVIQQISDQLMTVLERDREQMKSDPTHVYRLANEILVPRVDFSRVSGLALGKHWRRASDEQKAQFSEEFRRLLVRTYATAFHEFDTWEIKHIPVRMKSGDSNVTVRTKVIRPGASPVSVVYRMRQGQDSWKAYDVTIEGVSLVTNYRNSFSKEIRLRGMDGLISRLVNMNEQRMGRTASSGTKKVG